MPHDSIIVYCWPAMRVFVKTVLWTLSSLPYYFARLRYPAYIIQMLKLRSTLGHVMPSCNM